MLAPHATARIRCNRFSYISVLYISCVVLSFIQVLSQKVKDQGHDGSNMLEGALFGLVNAIYLENYWTEFHQTFSVFRSR